MMQEWPCFKTQINIMSSNQLLNDYPINEPQLVTEHTVHVKVKSAYEPRGRQVKVHPYLVHCRVSYP